MEVSPQELARKWENLKALMIELAELDPQAALKIEAAKRLALGIVSIRKKSAA